jgi:hypothetical protein
VGEIDALSARAKELKQELESVEGRLRELSGDRPLLTRTHAQRTEPRADRTTPIVAAAGAVAVLGLGIAIGWVLRTPAAPLPTPKAPPIIVTLVPSSSVAPRPPSSSSPPAR